MSSAYWQTRRRQEQYGTGKTVTAKVAAYVKTWQSRCYFDGIPDQLPKKVERSARAPSWRAIAIAILQNDHGLYSLGFSQRETPTSEAIYRSFVKSQDAQMSLNLPPAGEAAA